MDRVLKEVAEGFSNNQERVCKKIKELVGLEAAVALVSMQGVSNTSQQEIDFVANLISTFGPYKITSYKRFPKHLELEALVDGAYKLRVHPQFKVRQPDTTRTPRSKDWSVDLVIELIAFIDKQEHQIGIVGFEYDGHVSHYVQDGVREAYVRDAGILQEQGFNPVRVSPEGWRANPKHYVKSLGKYISRSIVKFEKIQADTASEINRGLPDNDYLYEAPEPCILCIGKGKFGGDDCPCCKGMGSLSRNHNKAINLEDYEDNSCPKCIGGSLKCKLCKGSGILSREKMLEIN